MLKGEDMDRHNEEINQLCNTVRMFTPKLHEISVVMEPSGEFLWNITQKAGSEHTKEVVRILDNS